MFWTSTAFDLPTSKGPFFWKSFAIRRCKTKWNLHGSARGTSSHCSSTEGKTLLAAASPFCTQGKSLNRCSFVSWGLSEWHRKVGPSRSIHQAAVPAAPLDLFEKTIVLGFPAQPANPKPGISEKDLGLADVMDTTPNKQICKSAYHSRGNPFFTYADGKVALFTCIFIYMFFIHIYIYIVYSKKVENVFL